MDMLLTRKVDFNVFDHIRNVFSKIWETEDFPLPSKSNLPSHEQLVARLQLKRNPDPSC